jgi:hypothetical protein
MSLEVDNRTLLTLTAPSSLSESYEDEDEGSEEASGEEGDESEDSESDDGAVKVSKVR